MKNIFTKQIQINFELESIVTDNEGTYYLNFKNTGDKIINTNTNKCIDKFTIYNDYEIDSLKDFKDMYFYSVVDDEDNSLNFTEYRDMLPFCGSDDTDRELCDQLIEFAIQSGIQIKSEDEEDEIDYDRLDNIDEDVDEFSDEFVSHVHNDY